MVLAVATPVLVVGPLFSYTSNIGKRFQAQRQKPQTIGWNLEPSLKG